MPRKGLITLLVQDGETNAVVIIEEGAAGDVTEAADTLIQYVQKWTGAILAVMTMDEFEDEEEDYASHSRIYVWDPIPLRKRRTSRLDLKD